MSRQKKNQAVSTVKHGSGAVINIELNPNDLTFEARVIDGVVFKESSAQLVRNKVVEYLDKNTKIDWVPVICISEQKPFCSSDHAFIGIEIDRFYLGNDASGKIRQIRWDDFDEHFGNAQTDIGRINNSTRFNGLSALKLPHCSDRNGEGQTHYIAYSEPAWIALNQIREAISKLKDRLLETLNSEAGMKRLVDFGARALLMLPEVNKVPNIVLDSPATKPK